MARYDIYRVNSKKTPYVLDVQTNILGNLNTVVVIPLIDLQEANSESIDRLKPIIRIDGFEYVLITTDLSAFPRKDLGEFVCNIEEGYALTVVDAIDFLFQGF